MQKSFIIRALSRSLRPPSRFGILARVTVPVLVAGSAWGATATWDPAHNFTGSDGSGTWSTGAANWANGVSDAGWASGDTAVFGSGGTAGTVSVSGTVNVGGIVFNLVTGNYAVSGGTIGLGSTATITANSSATITSRLSGSSTVLTKDGTGTLTFNGTSTGISAINVAAGILSTGTSGLGSFGNSTTAISVADGAAISVASGAEIQNNITFNGGSGTAASIGGATLSGNVTLATGDTKISASNVAVISGKISGSGSLTLNGPNKLTLSGANDFSGGINIVDGTLQVTGGGTLGTGAVANATNLELNSTGGNLTIANAISGAGSITKSGTGTATLSGSVTSTGYTIISGGTLLVNGTKNGGTSALLYVGGTGAVLGGTGTIIGASAGAVTLLAGGAVSPGLPNTMGTLTVTSVAWTSDNVTAGMLYNLSTTDNTSDLLNVTGAFTRSSGTSYIFDFQGGGMYGQTYTLINYGGSTVNSVSNLVASNLANGLTGYFTLSGTVTVVNNVSTITNGALTFTVVPEPTEVGIGIAALAGLAIFMRRRRQAAN